MGLVYADIELFNAWELEASKKKILDQDDVKRMCISALVDTGALHLAINEDIQGILQLPVQERARFTMANGETIVCDLVNNVELRFKNRRCTVNAIVLPGSSEPLLGAIPMEEMDVLIDPRRQELIPNPEHPLYSVLKLK